MGFLKFSAFSPLHPLTLQNLYIKRRWVSTVFTVCLVINSTQKMGTCVNKADHGVVQPSVCEVSTEPLNTRRIKSSLLDMKKARCAPLLSLESNPRFNSRVMDYSRRRPSIDAGETVCSEMSHGLRSPTQVL